MSRKPLIYTHEHPYHIMARSNNKEWFHLPADDCWSIFAYHLNQLPEKFGFRIHLFVLMSNHYHLIGHCSEKNKLGEVMAWLQKSTSKAINQKVGRINHVYGGSYKACLIRHPEHFAAVYKYVARNPVTAMIVQDFRLYPYSTLTNRLIRSYPTDEWFAEMPKKKDDFINWINSDFTEGRYEIIRQQLAKTEFNFKSRSSRKNLSRE